MRNIDFDYKRHCKTDVYSIFNFEKWYEDDGRFVKQHQRWRICFLCRAKCTQRHKTKKLNLLKQTLRSRSEGSNLNNVSGIDCRTWFEINKIIYKNTSLTCYGNGHAWGVTLLPGQYVRYNNRTLDIES